MVRDRPTVPPPRDPSPAAVPLELALRNALAGRARFPAFETLRRLLVQEGVASLARHLGMSARSLRRHCANAGLCLAEQRKALQTEELERLLSTDIPVAVIAGRLGFSSPQTLARFLKQRFGATATQLRRRRVT